MVPVEFSSIENPSQQAVNSGADHVKSPESKRCTVNEAAPPSLVHCDRQLVKAIIHNPEEMQQHAAGLLIQSVFRGKQARKAMPVHGKQPQNQDHESPLPKLSISGIAQAKLKSAKTVSLHRHRQSTGTGIFEKVFEKIDELGIFEKIDDLGIPSEYRAQRGVLGLVLPCFEPSLENHYQISEMHRLSRHRYYAVSLPTIILVLILAGLFMDLSDLETGIPNWFIYTLVFLGLLLTWLGIFFQGGKLEKVCGMKKVFVLKGIAVITVTFTVLWQSFEGQSMTSEDSKRVELTTLVRIFLILIGWAALPQPKYLLPMLVINTCAPVIWLVGCTLRSHADISHIEHVCYFIVFGFMLYSACRKSDLDSRSSYLKSRQAQTTIKRKQEEITVLKKKSMSRMGTEGTEGFFQNLFDQEREKISKLKETLDNYHAKDEIQKLHEHLVSEYVGLGASDGTDAESIISGIEERFVKLKNLATKESDRLASILQDLYRAFVDLPEWEPILKLPTFSNAQRDSVHPMESLHQTSHCNWWSKPELYPSSLNRIGVAKEPLQWFSCRAQWAKTPYVEILKDAVSKFNQASCIGDLGLSPGQVMRLWNNDNPNNKMDDAPFPEGLSLVSNFQAITDHDYIEGGQHAGLQVGPNKERLRAQAKAAEYRGMTDTCPATEYAEKYVTDWLRARIVFVNPAALAAFFWYLMFCVPTLKVIRCKNKLVRDPLTKTARTADLAWCIHLNVQFNVQGEQHIAEIQLVLDSFCIAKGFGHKYYEFMRAESLADLLAPVLERVPSSSVGISKDVTASSTCRNPSTESNNLTRTTMSTSPSDAPQQLPKKIDKVHPAPDQTQRDMEPIWLV